MRGRLWREARRRGTRARVADERERKEDERKTTEDRRPKTEPPLLAEIEILTIIHYTLGSIHTLVSIHTLALPLQIASSMQPFSRALVALIIRRAP
jgi:hypothetical protein